MISTRENSNNKIHNFHDELLNIPKYDPHIHFEGSVTEDLLIKICSLNKLNPNTGVNIKGQIFSPPHFGVFENFFDFAGTFLKIVEISKTEGDFKLIAENFCRQLKFNNVISCTSYFTPTNFYLFQRNISQVLGYLKVAQDIIESSGININWIFDIVTVKPEISDLTLQSAIEAKSLGINIKYIGVAGPEKEKVPDQILNTLREAENYNFEIIPHCGERPESERRIGTRLIREFMDKIPIKRIGHGLSAAYDKELINDIIDRDIALEVSPISNINLKLFDYDTHPIKSLIDNGVKVIICSDDPGIFKSSLNENYLALRKIGVADDVILDLAKKSLNYIEL